MSTIAVLYGAFHALVRLVLTSSIGEDDVMGNLYAQTFEWGYIKKNPPLYDWLLWAVQQVTGPTLFSFLFLKYVLWTGTAIFIYLSARRVLKDEKWAALTVFSLTLTYQIGWNIHEGVTHTAALSFVVALTFWAFLRLLDHGRPSDYAIFGICIGLGFLSKFGFAAFLIMLLGAAGLQSAIRKKLKLTGLALSFAIGLLAFSPFALWVLNAPGGLGTGAGGAAPGYFTSLVKGIPPAIHAPLEFLAPLIVILPIVFIGIVGALRKQGWAGMIGLEKSQEEPDLEKLLLHMFLIGWALLIALVVFVSYTRILARYMHPFALLAVIWLAAQAKRAATEIEVRRYLYILGAAALLVMGFRLVNLTLGDPLCKNCRQLEPYQELADAVRDKGYDSGLIIGGDRYIAGNMRTFFPRSWIACENNPRYVPPKDAVSTVKQVAVITRARNGSQVLTGFAHKLARQYGANNHPRTFVLDVPWRNIAHEAGYRSSRFQLFIFDVDTPHP